MEEFLMSVEEECLTASPEHPELVILHIERLLGILPRLSPSLAGVSGVFTPYGRIYPDCGHIELAAIECDSPYVLPGIVERQHMLVTRAVEELAAEGHRLVLANNNHSGLLQAGCNVWGSHENYLTSQHPAGFGRWILPFLVTRIYGGAGGVLYPSGDFVAGVRPVRMEMAEGGGTTSCRAIHSTARDEHHMGSRPRRYRYHLLLGDGHRSHFNLALQVGATALALKAIQHDKELRNRIEQLEGLPADDGWVPLLREINLLAKAGGELRIHPRVVPIQRLYREGAERFTAGLKNPRAWIARTLQDWDETLLAMENLDRRWLAAKLDAFTKYEVYSGVVEAAGCGWKGVARAKDIFHELALLDHSYHEFTNPQSLFCRLERAGLLEHRVADPIAPGSEAESYIPEVATRARARARFIRDHDKQPNLVADWSFVYDRTSGQTFRLLDPFAEDFKPVPKDSSLSNRMRSIREMLLGAESLIELDEVPF
ncbi:MAG: proteasome accessory factor PafA2 family protein [Pirellulales bacterium]|nr:proteasome accessory factor PafA2 family protein [Pirellulales bacterium]